MHGILGEFLMRVRAIKGINEPTSWGRFSELLSGLSELQNVIRETQRHLHVRGIPPELSELQSDVGKLQQQVVALERSLRRWEAGSDSGLEDWGRLNNDIQSIVVRCRELMATISLSAGAPFDENVFLVIRERNATVPRHPPVEVPETLPDNEEEP